MSTLALPEMEKEESGPLTAEGLLRRRARQRPGAVALIGPETGAPADLGCASSHTYAEADEAVDTLAAHFIDLGLEPGDRIAMQLPNSA
ncbi:MAG: AMP-binding protein [Methyloceanibacter sp.]